MAGRKPIQVPEDVWEKLKAKAEAEKRSIADVVADLLKLMPEEADAIGETSTCVYCGNPSPIGRRICDDCFFDPFVVRPQVFVALYYHFAMTIAPDANLKGTFDEFVAWLSEKIAKDFYGVKDDEWEVWQKWLEWRRAFLNNEATTQDPDWRRFVVWTNKDGFCGDRAAWRILTLLFGVVKER